MKTKGLLNIAESKAPFSALLKCYISGSKRTQKEQSLNQNMHARKTKGDVELKVG